jgi:hypothetical protein
MSKPLNNLTDEHMSDAEKATLREWETKILRHLAITPESPSGVMALQPIVVKRKEDIANYYNAINWLRDRGWIDHESLPSDAAAAANDIASMKINEDGLAELERRHVRY